MSRGNTDLSSNSYDTFLTEKSKRSRGARRELEQRKAARKNAHDSEGVGYHFGLGNEVVHAKSKEHFKHELDKRGLMLETDVKKDLRGVSAHEYLKRGRK